jgi:hypothetical protein
VCDFVTVIGDDPEKIGDATISTNSPKSGIDAGRPFTFKAERALEDQRAFLIFNIRGMMGQSIKVWLNKELIGYLTRNMGGDLWETQMIAISGGHLKDGDNSLWIEGNRLPAAYQSNYLEFEIKDMFCFFKQRV